MKQDSAAWKFRTQKSDDIIYFDFEDKFESLLEVYFIHTTYRFEAWEIKNQTF